jgi:nicotinamide phosphoribosyltransferase
MSTINEQRAKLWEELKLLGDPRTIRRPEDNPILDVDSYKLCHQIMYKTLKCTGAFSYVEPRIKNEEVEFFGLQMWAKRFKPITYEDIAEAKEFFSKHIENGAELFPEQNWIKVVEVYNGYPPLKIRALPEGMVVPSQNALVTIECDERDLAWMAAYFETTIMRAVWYPTTVASRSRKVRNMIKHFLEITADFDD